MKTFYLIIPIFFSLPFVGFAQSPEAVVSSANASANAAILTKGHQALLQRHAGFQMPVYTSAPVAATKKGIPYPQFKDGKELLWNHLLRWRGDDVSRTVNQLVVGARGNIILDCVIEEQVLWKYGKDDLLAKFLQKVKKPSRNVGQNLLIYEPVKESGTRRVWRYNPALRRPQRAPGVEFDFPGTCSNGQRTSDNFDMFNGSPEQYNWQIVAKDKKMVIPYNATKLAALGAANKVEDAVGPGHLKPNTLRYEVHPVHVLEATLKPGVKNVYSKRTFYIDPNSFAIVAADLYDSRGQLWRVQESHSVLHPGGIYWEGAMTVYDLKNNDYVIFSVVGTPKFNTGLKDGDFNQRNVR